MTGPCFRLAAAALTITVLANGGRARPVLMQAAETPCRPAADLRPKASAGRPSPVRSDLSRHGELLLWEAAIGDTLRLNLVAADNGTYRVSLAGVHGPDAAVISARLWDDPLTRDGRTRIALQRGARDELVEVRFDAVSLGPGRHVLELSCLEPGAVLLDCVALGPTDEVTAPAAGDGPFGRPFLGVEMGESSGGGVTINRVIAGSAAADAGLRAGDVILRLDGEQTASSGRLSETILEHRPGDRVEVVLLRSGATMEMVVTLGRRTASSAGARAARVLEVLDVGPGQVIADIGAGSGWLAEAIAQAAGPEGLVYAVEISEDHVRRLRRWRTPNVVPVLSVPHDVCLPAGSLDTAMLHDVASHVTRSARPKFYESIARALKPKGRLVIFGPHGRARFMLDELRDRGFVPVAAEEPDDLDQWLRDGIVFRYTGPAPS